VWLCFGFASRGAFKCFPLFAEVLSPTHRFTVDLRTEPSPLYWPPLLVFRRQKSPPEKKSSGCFSLSPFSFQFFLFFPNHPLLSWEAMHHRTTGPSQLPSFYRLPPLLHTNSDSVCVVYDLTTRLRLPAPSFCRFLDFFSVLQVPQSSRSLVQARPIRSYT